MKRILAMVLAIGILFTSTIAYAEEFSLRNGITFGDTIEEVLAKETFSIESVDDGSDEDSVEDKETDDESELPYSITTAHDTLAGIPDSHIVYRFDQNKTLKEVKYYFRSSSLKETIDNDYNNINSGFIRKYGSPLGYSNGDCYIFTGGAMYETVYITYLVQSLDGYGDLRDYDEWDVNTGDYHVKIEHIEYYLGSSYSDLNYSHVVSYTYFTDEDLQNAKNEKVENQNAIDNDL